MKIAFLMPPTLMGRQNGVVSQALTWKEGLEDKGVIVDLVTPWETYHWDSYEAIHAFGTGHYLDILPLLKERGARRIVLSPIYDSNRHSLLANALSRLEFPVGMLRTTWAALRSSVPYVDMILARSDFEASKISKVFGAPRSKIDTIRLPVRFRKEDLDSVITREPICSHVSILSAPIKNVKRLIEASIKYSFPLHLAGRINDANFRCYLDKIVHQHNNVLYHGVLSDENLKKLYCRSKVFALPSLMEGVGLVGLEAAVCGADIVITDRGGPKEYYAGLASIVNPESIDEIGSAVRTLLDSLTHQPNLSFHIAKKYSLDASIESLISVYKPV